MTSKQNYKTMNLAKLEKNLKIQENKIKKISPKHSSSSSSSPLHNSEINEDNLRNQIQIEEKNQHIILDSQQELNNLKLDINKIQKEKDNIISKFTIKYPNIDINNLPSQDETKNQINLLSSQIEEQEKQKDIHTKNIELINSYFAYKKEKDQYDSWSKQKNELIINETLLRKKYATSQILYEKILEAESISLISIIESINSHVQVYIEEFFPDTPIIVSLSCFKEVKKNNKPQINLDVNYEGNDCTLDSLSGGEADRIVLAFTLGLSEIFETPMLLLDEVTGSLDEKSTTIVFDTLKKHVNNKLVIVIAHQVTEGIFDDVKNLTKEI